MTADPNQLPRQFPPDPTKKVDPSTDSSALAAPASSHARYPAVVVTVIRQAQSLNRLSLCILYIAIGAFLVLGTLKSMPMFIHSQQLYWLFYYVPYALVGLTIPLSCYVAFVLYRYRLSQPSMIATCLGVGFGLFFFSSYVALAAWIGVAFMFRTNLKRFFDFLYISSQNKG